MSSKSDIFAASLRLESKDSVMHKNFRYYFSTYCNKLGFFKLIIKNQELGVTAPCKSSRLKRENYMTSISQPTRETKEKNPTLKKNRQLKSNGNVLHTYMKLPESKM